MVRCALQPQNQIVCQQLYNVLVERLRGIVIGAVWFDEDKLQAEISAVLGVVYEVPEELIHIRLKDISEVYWIVNLCKN